MTNSLVSKIYNTSKTAPVKGGAVTFLHWTDRKPGTIAEVLYFKTGAKAGEVRAIVVQADDYRVISGSTYDGSAQYEITPNANAPKQTFRLTDTGWKSPTGNRLAIGMREVWTDPSF